MRPLGLRRLQRPLLGAIVVAALIVALAHVQQKSSPERFLARHAQVLAQLGMLRQADREWTVQILGAQAGLAVNYDPLSRAADAMSEVQHEAVEGALALGVPAGSAELAQLEEAVQRKWSAAERMKSERAILANSLRFLPTHVDQIAVELRERRSRPAQREAAQAVLDATNIVARAVLRAVSHPDAAAVGGLDHALAALQEVHARHAALRDMADRFELLDVHARAVLRHRERAQQASREALDAPVVGAVDAIEAQAGRVFRARMEQAQRYRGFLFLLAALLCAVAVSALAGWLRSYRALRAAHADLARQLEETRRLMYQAAELKQEATHDPLTGLANRRLVEDRLEHALRLAERRAGVVAVLFVDLDGFKAVNDRYGHGVGDLLLIDVARRLKQQVRDADTVSRLGGDEFLLVLEATSEAGARRAAEAIIADLQSIDRIGRHEVAVAASIGVVVSEPGAPSAQAEALLQRADAAMYEAKRAGKGRYALVSVRGADAPA